MPKAMCKLAKKTKLKKIARHSDNPEYICKKCGRVANDRERLCKPVEMEA